MDLEEQILADPWMYVTSFLEIESNCRLTEVDIALTAATTKSVVPVSSYWDSTEAKRLFNPHPTQAVIQCLEEMIVKLQKGSRLP